MSGSCTVFSRWLCLGKVVGSNGLQRSLPTPTIVCASECVCQFSDHDHWLFRWWETQSLTGSYVYIAHHIRKIALHCLKASWHRLTSGHSFISATASGTRRLALMPGRGEKASTIPSLSSPPKTIDFPTQQTMQKHFPKVLSPTECFCLRHTTQTYGTTSDLNFALSFNLATLQQLSKWMWLKFQGWNLLHHHVSFSHFSLFWMDWKQMKVQKLIKGQMTALNLVFSDID